MTDHRATKKVYKYIQVTSAKKFKTRFQGTSRTAVHGYDLTYLLNQLGKKSMIEKFARKWRVFKNREKNLPKHLRNLVKTA